MILYILLYCFIATIGFVTYRLWNFGWNFNEYICHGPRASEITNCTWYDNNTNKYYVYKIKMFVCPPSINKMFQYSK